LESTLTIVMQVKSCSLRASRNVLGTHISFPHKRLNIHNICRCSSSNAVFFSRSVRERSSGVRRILN